LAETVFSGQQVMLDRIEADDIAPTTDIREFREKLRRDGYQPKWENCLRPGCGHSVEAKLHLVNFGEVDGVLPAEETFL